MTLLRNGEIEVLWGPAKDHILVRHPDGRYQVLTPRRKKVVARVIREDEAIGFVRTGRIPAHGGVDD